MISIRDSRTCEKLIIWACGDGPTRDASPRRHKVVEWALCGCKSWFRSVPIWGSDMVISFLPTSILVIDHIYINNKIRVYLAVQVGPYHFRKYSRQKITNAISDAVDALATFLEFSRTLDTPFFDFFVSIWKSRKFHLDQLARQVGLHPEFWHLV